MDPRNQRMLYVNYVSIQLERNLKKGDYTVKFEFLHSLRTFREFGNIRPSLLHGIDPICMEVCLF